MCKDEKTKKVIEEFKSLHTDRYDYSKTIYEGCHKRLIVTCKEHGDFTISQVNHKNMRGCPTCGRLKTVSNSSSNKEEFTKNARLIHKDAYDYTRVVYINNKTKVLIVCPIHGEFTQSPSHHLNGAKCPRCALISRTEKRSMGAEEFIKRSKFLHKEKYSYDKVVYKNNIKKVVITCPIHGDFSQSPSNHLSNMGCSQCGKPGTKLEGKITDFLDSINIKYERNKWYTTNTKRWEVDIFIPDHNLGIECHGNYWHSEATKGEDKAKVIHKNKYFNSLKEGFTLLQFFEDEINLQFEAVTNIIKSKIFEKRNYDLSLRKIISENCRFDVANCIINFWNKNKTKELPKFEIGYFTYVNCDEIKSLILFYDTKIVGYINTLSNNFLKESIAKYTKKNLLFVADSLNETYEEFLKNDFNLSVYTDPKFKYVKEASNSLRLRNKDDDYKYRIWDAGYSCLIKKE